MSDNINRDRELTSDIEASVGELNQRLAAASENGLTCKIEVMDVTTLCDRVPVHIVNVRVSRETRYN